MRASALGEGQRLVVDLLGLADHARDRAEPAGDPDRAGVDKVGQGVCEHHRIELIGLAVDVEIGARKVGAHQRHAIADHAGEHLVDIAVFGAAQGVRVELGAGNEFRRIEAPAMGRIEHHRRAQGLRIENLEGRVEPLRFEKGVSALFIVHTY